MGTPGWAALDSPRARALPGRKNTENTWSCWASPARLQEGAGDIWDTGDDRDIGDTLSARDTRDAGGARGFWGCWECWGAGDATAHTHLSEGGAVGVKLTNPSGTRESSSTSKSSMGYKCSPSKNEDVMNNADYSVNDVSWGGCAYSVRFSPKLF